MNKDSKIYIAGHTGLVGSSILRNLKNKGYSNFVFTPYPEFDLRDQKIVENFFQKEKPEYVFFAAAKVGGIVANNTYRAEFIYDNLQIQNNIIHFSYKYDVKKLLFLGSSCIYPKNCPQPMKEDYLLTDTLEYTNEPYAIAKIAGIKMCESYNLQYGTNFISVMPTNLYGLNDNYDLEKSHVLPAIIRKMHLGKCLMENNWKSIRLDLNELPIEGVDGISSEQEIKEKLSKFGIELTSKNSQLSTNITLWGSGKPRREFLYSDDLADACVFLMENINFSDLKGDKKEIKDTHINIGVGKDISITELADTVKEIIDFEGEIIWDKSKPDGTIQKLLDVNKLHSLGWNEKVKLNEGIRTVYLNYIKK
ncbi:MAG: NAD-dependent epimerase/dehydratase family protein [Bacteroidales bacterium]|nr:NAD-dependent epimerase/dehydratase family protein [Bacteroidales bacterium]